MMLDFATMLDRYNMRGKITGVLHCGARIGEERVDYQRAGISRVWWVDANPAIIPALTANVARLGHKVINACLWDVSGERKTFHVTNHQGMSSSLLEFGTHKSFSPDTVFERHIEVETSTLDQVVAVHGITDVNYLEMDLQGVELPCLRGATQLLPKLDYISSEINNDEVYVGCTRIEALDAFLADFKRVETLWCGNQGWGDCLYIRKTLL